MIRTLWSQRLHLLPIFFYAVALSASAISTYRSASDASRPTWEAWTWAWTTAMWMFSLILSTSTAILDAQTRGRLEARGEEAWS